MHNMDSKGAPWSEMCAASAAVATCYGKADIRDSEQTGDQSTGIGCIPRVTSKLDGVETTPAKSKFDVSSVSSSLRWVTCQIRSHPLPGPLAVENISDVLKGYASSDLFKPMRHPATNLW